MTKPEPLSDDEIHTILDELMYDTSNEKPPMWFPEKPWYVRLYNKIFKRKQ